VNARDRQVAELRAQALDLRTRGYAALDAGDGKLAQELLDRAILRDEIADGLEAGEGAAPLRAGVAGDNNLSMTRTQRERRGRAVAKARADGLVAKAIVASRWKTASAYARKLGLSQPALSRYITGSLACPAEVDRAVRRDFPALATADAKDLWPKGVIE
jgi:hypothetical protein